MADTTQQGAGATGDDAPKPLTAEDVANITNAAITAHEKRNAAKRAEELKTLIADAVKSAAPPPPTPPAGGSGTGAGTSDGKDTPETAALRARLEELEKAAKTQTELVTKEREQRIAAENKARDDRTFNDLRTALSKKVRPEMLDDVAKLHFFADKRVEYSEDGQPLFKARRSPGGGLPEEDVLMPLADGVENWAKSKEAARWLPPPNGSGSNGGNSNGGGQRTGRPVTTFNGPARTDEEKAARAMQREQELRDRGHGD